MQALVIHPTLARAAFCPTPWTEMPETQQFALATTRALQAGANRTPGPGPRPGIRRDCSQGPALRSRHGRRLGKLHWRQLGSLGEVVLDGHLLQRPLCDALQRLRAYNLTSKCGLRLHTLERKSASSRW